jgi:hypothetical protein
MSLGIDPFAKLDFDTITQIMGFIPPIDIIRLQKVSRLWWKILGSERVSRVALIRHFPHSSETFAFKRARACCEREDGGDKDTKKEKETSGEISAVMIFRRCVYRSYTRSMGWPTTVSHLVIDDGSSRAGHGIIQWDASGGKITANSSYLSFSLLWTLFSCPFRRLLRGSAYCRLCLLGYDRNCVTCEEYRRRRRRFAQ